MCRQALTRLAPHSLTVRVKNGINHHELTLVVFTNRVHNDCYWVPYFKKIKRPSLFYLYQSRETKRFYKFFFEKDKSRK